jgi:hypothetical protein
MVLQIIHVGILVTTGLAAVSLLIQVSVWLARRVRPVLDPKATEADVLRFLGNTSGYACLGLILAQAMIQGEQPSERMIEFLTMVGIVGLALIMGGFIDLARDRPKK